MSEYVPDSSAFTHRPFFEIAGPDESTVIAPNDDQFHQKPRILGADTCWMVPRVLKYAASNAANIPPVAKAFALVVHQGERAWNKAVDSEWLPMGLEGSTLFSMALVALLNELASLTRKNHGYAVMLLRQAYSERRAAEAAQEDLPAIFSTIPTEVGKQPKKKFVEAQIWENRAGLTLKDVHDAIRTIVRANKKVRFHKGPGETKKEMRSRVKKESKRSKKEVQKTIRSVVSHPEMGKAPRKQIFKAIEKRMERPLRKNERREVTKESQRSSGTSKFRYSLAASGPAGSIYNVLKELPEVELPKDKKNTELALRPGLSEAGQQYLERNKYMETIPNANATVVAPEPADPMSLDTMADGEPSEPGGTNFHGRRTERQLSALMGKTSVSPPETDAGEPMDSDSMLP